MNWLDLPVFPHRPPNLAPAGIYRLPEADRELAPEVTHLLRVHPMAYETGGQWFARCPTCEQWTGADGCDVRNLAVRGEIDAAKELHVAREWPAGTGYATTRYRGVEADYSLVKFEYVLPASREQEDGDRG